MTTLDAMINTMDMVTEAMGLPQLQRAKDQEMIGHSVFEEPMEESLEHKCQRLTELIGEIMAETDAIGMMADHSALSGLKIKVQMMTPDFDQLFAGMDTACTIHASGSGYMEKSITLGGVTFFALFQESAADRAARMLRDLPEEERHRLLESLK